MKLLHLDSSALGANSATRELSAAIVARWQADIADLSVEYRDLDSNPVPHLTGASLAATDPEAATESGQVLQQFLDADIVVVGAPMYNFSIPSTLKAWIDRIAVAGKTFRYTAKGPEGLATGKRVIVASARGGLHSGAPSDFQEPYLRFLFGFMGITDVEFIRAEGLGLSPQHRSEALAAAHAAIGAPLAKAA
ncbi:FMN-dependent NADH-azoreductase [Luteimonas mephitis]|jgi:FMN-dependent NADH-azoreductase|uniref:FMN-dependent NADH-azoreductase n=1 Tax=Luteimonas mephitis TaxID=83615 RepID=UPI0004101D16|nr:NAD(P)H-dependent oxidoreductase [Luteimonas mephitis]